MTGENNNINNPDQVKTEIETTQVSGETVTPAPVTPVETTTTKTAPSTHERGERSYHRPERKFYHRPEGGSSGSDTRRSDQKTDMNPRMPKFKKKLCRFCIDKEMKIDYKGWETLGRFITDRGKILPRRVTGTCARHQRELSNAIKRARHIALIPYIEK